MATPAARTTGVTPHAGCGVTHAHPSGPGHTFGALLRACGSDGFLCLQHPTNTFEAIQGI